MLTVLPLESLVFGNKAQIFLLVQVVCILANSVNLFFLFFDQFRVHDIIHPFHTSIDPLTCGVAIETLS